MVEGFVRGFKEVFDRTDEPRVFFSPGRVNLIGEHTDYNGGFVLPCALSIGTYIVIAPRGDRRLRFYSGNFTNVGIIESSLDELSYQDSDDWANYPKGIISIFRELGYEGNVGFDAYFFGNIPNGAGLSSSASIELAMGIAWDEFNKFKVDRLSIVKLCQRAENQYIGVNCGIMDQFAIGFGKQEHAILLDCNTLDYSYAPVKLNQVKLVLANTNKRRGLADSKYNERREECDQALEDLQKKVQIENLCSINGEQFKEYSNVIKNETIQRRAKHVIEENDRTKKAHEMLRLGDIVGFGRLMNDSHQSLKENYQVTGEHLDTLVEAATGEPTVLGARMTGAGFGGCTVNLMKEENMEVALERIANKYKQQTGIETEFYVVEIGDGSREITKLKSKGE